MLTTKLRIILISALLVLPKLAAMDDETGIPTDDSLPKPPSKVITALASDDAFSKLMSTLRIIPFSKDQIQPWKDAILTFQRASSTGSEVITLKSILDRILGESLAKRRVTMVEKAISSLTNSAESPTSKMFPYTIILNPASAPKPILTSSGRKFRDTSDLTCSTAADTTAPIGIRSIPAPVIMANMKKFIAGQDEALEQLSFLAHRFLCNKLLIDSGHTPASGPAHCILTGPTGCGKSESLKQLGIFLGDVPILHINARSLTDEGFKGQNFSEAVANFCEENNNPTSAIVAIDEIDKLGTNDIAEAKNFGRAVQRVLLSPLDGNPLSLKRKQFKLTNWWFVGTGAFSHLHRRHDTSDERSTTARTHKDIISAGFEPEFVGRFSSIIPFKEHTVETMIDVINRENSPLRRIQNEFRLFYGIDLGIEASALRHLAATSIQINLGVRSLYTILNKALQPFYNHAMELMATQGDKSLIVTSQDIQPAIAQFIRDNKEIKEELPESIRHLYM